jgi:cytidylate kinase|tara:strand:+ start:4635 stop:5321 length:687 start_codon:yes stop_codon:yes gene_type:complete
MTRLQRFVVTIDGSAGTGKSTVAQELARRLGTECLDTGAMYRAVTVLAVDHGFDPTNGKILSNAIREIGIRFDWEQNPPTIYLGDENVSKRIRDLEIGDMVSVVAKQPEVRKVLVEQQREISKTHPLLVTEGRDQGSVVFPQASARFFLKADVEERTRRRVKQLQELGSEVNIEEVRNNIETRDHIDSTRKDSPLVCPDGATVIDTSRLTITEVVDAIESEVAVLLNS